MGTQNIKTVSVIAYEKKCGQYIKLNVINEQPNYDDDDVDVESLLMLMMRTKILISK
jgi:hypothetical protein